MASAAGLGEGALRARGRPDALSILLLAAALASAALLLWAVSDLLFAGAFLAGLIATAGLLFALRRPQTAAILPQTTEAAPADTMLLRAAMDGAGSDTALALTDSDGAL